MSIQSEQDECDQLGCGRGSVYCLEQARLERREILMRQRLLARDEAPRGLRHRRIGAARPAVARAWAEFERWREKRRARRKELDRTCG